MKLIFLLIVSWTWIGILDKWTKETQYLITKFAENNFIYSVCNRITILLNWVLKKMEIKPKLAST